MEITGQFFKEENEPMTSQEKELLLDVILEAIEKKGYLFVGITK